MLTQRFESGALDRSVWVPWYLPHWSSRASAPHGFGIGLHSFRDPRLTEDWSVVDLPIDIAAFHAYAVDWHPDDLTFTVDGEVVKRVGHAPDYPVQLEIAVFDFPDKAGLVPGEVPVPELVVSHVLAS